MSDQHGAMPDEPDQPTGEGTGGQDRGTPATQQLGRVVLVIVAVLFVVFALDNAQAVDFSWIFGETRVVERGGERAGGVPLIVLMLASFAAGATVATLLGWQRHRRRR